MGSVAEILGLIEQARANNEIGNDQARAASVALQLQGDDALLACRVIAQDSDPASLDYLDTGSIAPKIMDAHLGGPGVFKADDPDLDDYLALCALSSDESRSGKGTLRGRMWGFFYAMTRLSNPDDDFREAALKQLAREELSRIRSLKYRTGVVGGQSMRIYNSDRGFAAAAWDGESVSAVQSEDSNGAFLAVGAPPYCPPLSDQGVTVDKAISPYFGIVKIS